uniref:DNA-directed RNA polymerase n=1 Tax=Eptatretus burgeri TaxID=7764 RepID=A0A8C4WZK8_EPTBU
MRGRSGFLQDMEQNGFTLQYMFDHYPFLPEERELGLHTVRRVRPDFSWQYQHRNGHYSLPLIAECYDQLKKEIPSFPRLPFTANELRQMFKKQLAMEEAGFVTVESVKVSRSVNPDTASQRKGRIEHLRSHWRKELLLAFRDAKSKINPRRANHFGTSIYPFLQLLPEEDYIDIMIMVMTTLPPNGEAMIVFAKDLGRKVQSRFCIKRKQKLGITALVTKVYDHYVELLASDGKVHNKFPREYWQELERDLLHWYAYGHQDVNWSDATTMQLGTFLANIMVSGMNIPKNAKNPLQQRLIPAVYHTYNYQSKRKIGFIKPHPMLTQILESDQNSSLIFDAFVMPTYCPPVPWTSPTFGGYIVVPTQLIRMEEGITKQRDLLDHCKEEDPSKLHVILDTVNQLGNCPWHINEEVLDVIISLFNSGGSTQLGVPPPPSAGPILPKYDPTGKTGIADRTAYNNDMRLARKTLFEMHSLHMDAEYKLSIANALRHRTFWFPHNIDFRGRSYSCPPHFNHIGSDTTRSLLQFAEGQPLGPNGFDWLKIHLVNLMGRNKCESLSERLRYANAHMEDILDSADRPLEGHRWWMKSDEPWQTLACCKEIAKAVRSPDPAAFISHLPVHQDGSCNGLQHYAALGRDVVGAASVNLIPHELPQDVYEVVAQKVEQHRLRDAANGLQIAQVLEGFINRKVVKQTVMTVVYGVTRYGARLQVEKRLDELEDFPKAHVWKASIYLSRGIFHSLKEMFASTREIQEWLTESARLISMAGYSVEWISPVGLPIIQPYHHIKYTNLKSGIQTVSVCNMDMQQKPHTMKQKNAFPPNFIHSLDSTHMMLTALNCYRKGLTFVSIHDCFWTHAKTVDIMNQVCREQFVALHSQPILENLSKFLLRKHSGLLPEKTKERERHLKLLDVLTRVPKKGELVVMSVSLALQHP